MNVASVEFSLSAFKQQRMIVVLLRGDSRLAAMWRRTEADVHLLRVVQVVGPSDWSTTVSLPQQPQQRLQVSYLFS